MCRTTHLGAQRDIDCVLSGRFLRIGMSVMVRVPADKGASDVLQLQVPQALMDPEFQQKQMAARQLQQQGLAIIDFKVPEDKKAGVRSRLARCLFDAGRCLAAPTCLKPVPKNALGMHSSF